MRHRVWRRVPHFGDGGVTADGDCQIDVFTSSKSNIIDSTFLSISVSIMVGVAILPRDNHASIVGMAAVAVFLALRKLGTTAFKAKVASLSPLHLRFDDVPLHASSEYAVSLRGFTRTAVFGRCRSLSLQSRKAGSEK